MRFEINSYYMIGMNTFVCIEANEKHALVVPTETGWILDQQTGNIITEPTELEFEKRTTQEFFMDPNRPWFSKHATPTDERECKNCGKSFKRNKKQEFCGGACRQESYRKRNLKKV